MSVKLILIRFSLQHVKLSDNGSDGPKYVENQLQAIRRFSLKCFVFCWFFDILVGRFIF